MEPNNKPRISIYTDGACVPNPGSGGWAAILRMERAGRSPVDKEIVGSTKETTSIRMELTAAVEALRALNRPCIVDFYSDSRYLCDGVRHWLPRWKMNDWRLSGGNEVKNIDLWKELDRLIGYHKVNWNWIKGHSDNLMNQRVDSLARKQIHPHQLNLNFDEGNHLFIRGICFSDIGGWGVVLLSAQGKKEISGAKKNATANYMEILAAIEGLKKFSPENEINVYTLNNYIYSAITHDIHFWITNDWHTGSGSPVQHIGLWKLLLEAQRDKKIIWHLVRKSDNVQQNADAMKIAKLAVQKVKVKCESQGDW